jgi:AraC-like DNA-binding protein
VRLVAVAPSPRLSGFVETFWFVRGRPDYVREKVLPNGVIELIFNLGPPHMVVDALDPSRTLPFYDAWFAGLQERSLVIQAFDAFDLVGIRFKPGGAAPFLRFSPAELTNHVVECSSLPSAQLRALVSTARSRLLAAPTLSDRVRVLEELLHAQLDADWSAHPAVRLALRSLAQPMQSRIGAISQAARLSHKHLIGRFREQVGTTPSELLQIQRFQHALRQVSGLSRDEVQWTRVAHAAGYYDQAHMIRAFRRYADATPSDYLRARDADENHIIIER